MSATVVLSGDMPRRRARAPMRIRTALITADAHPSAFDREERQSTIIKSAAALPRLSDQCESRDTFGTLLSALMSNPLN
jgi:hypothetical protein